MSYLRRYSIPIWSIAVGLSLVGCGSDYSASFAGGDNGSKTSSQNAEGNTSDDPNGSVGSDSDLGGNNPRTPTDATAELDKDKVRGGSDGDAGDDGTNDTDTGNKDEIKIDAGELVVSCANASNLRTITETITFAPQKDCHWGSVANGVNVESANENWPIRQGFIQAREDQVHKVAMPQNAIVCGANLQSETDEIHFDDYYAIRLNNVILAASQVIADNIAPQSNGLIEWSWEELRGKGLNDAGHYCMAGDSSCKLPEHDRAGELALDLTLGKDADANSPQAKLFAKLSGASELELVATATGDNDDNDCDHSGGTFTLTLTYLGK